MVEGNSTPEDNGGSIEIEVPEIEFKEGDPLHRAALDLAVKRGDPLNEAMFLLSESRAVLDLLSEQLDSAPGAMVRDVRRRVHKAIKALDKQEEADRDLYLAFAETQRT